MPNWPARLRSSTSAALKNWNKNVSDPRTNIPRSSHACFAPLRSFTVRKALRCWLSSRGALQARGNRRRLSKGVPVHRARPLARPSFQRSRLSLCNVLTAPTWCAPLEQLHSKQTKGVLQGSNSLPAEEATKPARRSIYLEYNSKNNRYSKNVLPSAFASKARCYPRCGSRRCSPSVRSRCSYSPNSQRA
jgi:hypothetical protein